MPTPAPMPCAGLIDTHHRRSGVGGMQQLERNLLFRHITGSAWLHRLPMGRRRQQGRDQSASARPPASIAGITGKIVQIATSNSDGYALASTGAVYGWGVNTYGELGDGQLTPLRDQGCETRLPCWRQDHVARQSDAL